MQNIRPGGRGGRVIAVAALVTVLSCDALPVEPDPDSGSTAPTTVDAPIGGASGVGLLADGAWIIAPARWSLISTADQLAAGEYRFEGAAAYADSILRDHVMVVAVDGEPTPRRVLRTGREGGDLMVATGPALWSDVINGGHYSARFPLDGSGADIVLPGLAVNEAVDVPPLATEFEINLCARVDSILALASDSRRLCKAEKDYDFTVSSVTVTLAGVIDSLMLVDGDIEVSGAVALDLVVDGGGVYGGTAPTFAPCHRAAYRGCLTTPTGAALIDWLRRYAPSIPEQSLSPVRICVPGTWIRVARGYWEGWTWTPPRYELCRITDIGELPTVLAPSVQSVTAMAQPRIRGGVSLFVQGDGKLGLKVPIPSIGYEAAVRVIPHVEVGASVGVFAFTDLTIKNTGATLRGTFDEEVRVTQSWTPDDGWSSATESIRSEQRGELVEIQNPDSLVFRLGMPVEIGAELSIISDSTTGSAAASAGDDAEPMGGARILAAAASEDTVNVLDWLNLGANAGLTLTVFEEITWSREQIHPTDPEIDNWHLSTDMVYELNPSAGISIPQVFIEPPVPLSWDETFEFGRLSYNDAWGRGNIAVDATTTGIDTDPDGYTVVVSRADTLPRVVDEGAIRKPAQDTAAALTETIGIDGSAVFGSGVLPCAVGYSDALIPPQLQAPVEGLRAAGVNIPTYGLAVRTCNLLLIARHTVELTGVAENCSVVGGAVRDSVWLLQRRRGTSPRSDTTYVQFAVECVDAGTLGAAEVAADLPSVTTGPLDVVIDGSPSGVVTAGDTVTLTGLFPGSRTFELGGLPSFCTAEPVAATVPEAGTVDVTLTAACDIPVDELDPGEVAVSLVSTGSGEEPDAFLIKVDGVVVGGATPGSDAIVSGIPAATPTVFLLSHEAGNCRVSTTNPLVVELNATADPQAVEYSAECTAAAIDTLRGEVTTTSYPVEAAYVQPEGGTEVRVEGPALDQLLLLGGTPVRVWGSLAGTTLDVFGYQVLSSLGEPRWVGVVTERDGVYWLLGEEAIELVDPPPGLTARVGDYVWVGGEEIEVSVVVPTVYGLIREGS